MADRPPIDLSTARILISNDDGIEAPGLKLLTKVARGLSRDVWVVAPELEQSGASHSLTLYRPLRARKLGPRRFAVDGTPTDCVLLAVNVILKDKRPSLMLSGVNAGGNLGEDVTYSGTVAAAMEATLLDVPSIAMSQHVVEDGPVRWATAERYAPEVIRRLAALPWPRHTLINVNFPDVPPDKVTGIAATTQGRRKIGDNLTQRVDPRGRPYYWIGPMSEETPGASDLTGPDTDLGAVAAGKVSVTPIFLDLTNAADAGDDEAHVPMTGMPEKMARLIMELRGEGISDLRVLAAIERVPREQFVPAAFAEQAFDNVALPIGHGQTISQPLVVALMTQALDVGERHKVLELGTGSGYQAAVLARLCRRVFTIERYRALLTEAEARFARLRLANITTRFGDGGKGWPEQAPFDRIIVTAAAPDVPGVLLDSLAADGVLVAPVGAPRKDQQLLRVRRTGDSFAIDDLGPVRFVPLVEGLPRVAHRETKR